MPSLALPLVPVAAPGLGARSQTGQRVGTGATIGAAGGYIYDQHKKGKL